jgi:hypothetical protein
VLSICDAPSGPSLYLLVTFVVTDPSFQLYCLALHFFADIICFDFFFLCHHVSIRSLFFVLLTGLHKISYGYYIQI